MHRTLLRAMVLAALVPAPLDAGGDAPGAEWIGKDRAEVVEKWGEPDKVKRRGDGREVLAYELSVFVGEAYRQDAEELSANVTFEKGNEDVPRKVVVHTEGATVEPVYEKFRYRFRLGPDGRVDKVDFPRKAAAGIPQP